jgi:hypothetical protein
MKRILFTVALIFRTAFATEQESNFKGKPSLNKTVSYPKVEYRYAFPLDRQCPDVIAPEWVSELKTDLPTWQASWDYLGQQALQKTLELTGHGFQHRDMIAALFICDAWRATSVPLMVKARWYLEGPTAHSARPVHLLVGITLQELLHTFVVENLDGPTPLLKEYGKETTTTRNHLHLYALMTAAYESIGWHEKLQEQLKFETIRDSTGEYERAIEIVKTRGAAPFVAEITKK